MRFYFNNFIYNLVLAELIIIVETNIALFSITYTKTPVFYN